MGKGLKKALGLGEPSKKEAARLRTEQGKKFDKAFRAALKQLNGHLEYTAIRADEGRHHELAEKREKSCSAYHAAVKKIDPANPAVAQEPLDQVLKAIEGLEASAENLRNYAETHYTAWAGKEPQFDDAADQVMEMVNWGHTKGAALQQVVTAISEQVKLRKYQDAVEALDQFVIKLGPIFTEFTAQADAKIGYETMLAEKTLTRKDFEAVKFATFAEWQEEIQGNLDAIEQTAKSKDYVTAFADLEPELLAIDEFLAAAAELQKSKEEYETARAELQPRLDKSKGWEVLHVGETVDRLEGEMEQAVADEDFLLALETLNKLSPEVDLKLQLIDKSVYESAARPHAALFASADGTVDPGHYTVGKAKAAYTAGKQELDALVAASRWSEASAKLPDTVAAAQLLVDQRDGFDRCTAEYWRFRTDIDYVGDLDKNAPRSPKWNEELLLYNAFTNHLSNGYFDEAIADIRALQPKVADLRARVAASDAKAIPKADAAADEIRALIGAANLTSLTNAEKVALIEKLQKLSPKKQRQLLEDLHMPSTALTPERRVMQIALYMAIEPDRKFVKADQKIRERYLTEISGDSEVTQAIRNWNQADASGMPLVDRKAKEKILKKIVAMQSKAYGIDVPEVDWIPASSRYAGKFQPSTGRLEINEGLLSDPNPDGIIETILHENAHNFQDELVKKLMRGELSKGHPMYEQARTLAITYGGDAYIETTEGKTPYKAQPKEKHAHFVGLEGAATL